MSTEVVIDEIPPCSFHADTPAYADGRTVAGYWAYMCKRCFDSIGVGLGTGRGQKLIERKSK